MSGSYANYPCVYRALTVLASARPRVSQVSQEHAVSFASEVFIETSRKR
jgi:hypothetical protein